MCRRDARIVDGSFTIPESTADDALAAAATFLTELEAMFGCLAPHVQAGSYLVWNSDRGEEWRYDFDGDRLLTSPE